MKKYILTFLGLALGLTVATSCSEDLLNIEQHGVIEVDKTYSEADDATADQLIADVYATVRYLMTGDWGVNYIMTNVVKVAEFWPGGSDPNDGPDYQKMAALTDDSETGPYKDIYQRLYKIIYKSNLIVEKLNDGSAGRKRVIAEAKCWRAWASARLTQLWGTAPLVTHTLDGINYPFDPANTPAEEAWPWIIGQYEEAAEDLPSKNGIGGQAAIGGRWTKEAAYAYIGQGYMWQNDYANAKVWLAKVINSGKYALWTKTSDLSQYGENTLYIKEKRTSEGMTWIDGNPDYKYLTLFRAEADFCDEYLLEIDTRSTTEETLAPYWWWAYIGWRADEIYNPANSSQQASSDGWGFVTPTRAFGSSFCKHDGNSVRRRAFIATWDEVYYDFPYLDASVRGIMQGKMLFDNQGYFRMKYYNWLDDMNPERVKAGNSDGNDINFPLMRYSNVLLLYAEACCMDGEGDADITGLQALNLVRNRAGLSDAPALDMDNATYGIKAERRFELCMEDCDRYVDLIRWGDYKSFITDTSDNGVGDYWGTSCAWLKGFKNPAVRSEDPSDTGNYDIQYDKLRDKGTWSDRLLKWPFPYEEMQTNKNLVQNEGW